MPAPLALAFSLIMSAAPAFADCNSPPATWGSDWSAYESWCRGCCGSFHRSGTQSRCEPGSNWGCRGSGAAASGSAGVPAVPTTLQGAVLQGIQSGIQQGMRNAAESRRQAEAAAAAAAARQRAEEERAAEASRQAAAALEAETREKNAGLEDRRKAARAKAKRAEAERARCAAARLRAVSPQKPGTKPGVLDDCPSGASAPPAGGLAPKDLSRRAPQAPPDPAAAALDCAAAEVYARAEALGPAGKALARDLRAELADVLAGLKAKPPSGKAGAVTSVSVNRDAAAAGPDGETQLLAAVLVTRDEGTGEVRLDVQSSVRAPGAPEAAAQVLAVLDGSGRLLASEGSPQALACLDRLAR